jgi:glycosyltransferase involved in cell wall biosynthesis
MKICHLFWGYAGGGVDKVVDAYSKMTTDAFDVEFVCLHGVDWGTNLDGLRSLNATTIELQNRADFSWVKKLASYIDQVQPNLIFAHGFNAPVVAVVAMFFAKHETCLVCSYHGQYHAPRLNRKPLAPVFNGLLHHIYKHHASKVVAVADHSRDFLISKGVPPEIVSTIHNGLPPRPEYQQKLSRYELDLSADDYVIGAASRLAPEKGLSHLLNAMPQICAKVPKARLIILGNGPEESELKRQTTALGLNDVVLFAGFRSDADAFLSLYNVFVLPSLSEYHSIALLEAMRARCPIVATNVGGNTESVCHQREALIVQAANPDSIASAIIQLAKDPALAKRLASAAKTRFETTFSEEAMLEKTHNWLVDTLK